MPNNQPIHPQARDEVTEQGFLDNRASVLDIAAYLDRLDRAAAPGNTPGTNDPDEYRDAALRKAIAILIDGKPQRARRVLELLSDPTADPIDEAPGKGAAGAYPGS